MQASSSRTQYLDAMFCSQAAECDPVYVAWSPRFIMQEPARSTRAAQAFGSQAQAPDAGPSLAAAALGKPTMPSRSRSSRAGVAARCAATPSFKPAAGMLHTKYCTLLPRTLLGAHHVSPGAAALYRADRTVLALLAAQDCKAWAVCRQSGRKRAAAPGEQPPQEPAAKRHAPGQKVSTLRQRMSLALMLFADMLPWLIIHCWQSDAAEPWLRSGI